MLTLLLKQSLPTLQLVKEQDLKQFGIYKLPQTVYQACHDTARGRNAVPRVRKLIIDYIEEAHPGFTLNLFEDLSNADCRRISDKFQVSFGLYYTLQPLKPFLKQ